MSNVSTTVKTIQDLMRKDAGTYGDAQRLEQLGWMLFLKIFDDREKVLAVKRKGYVSPLPRYLRWSTWASDEKGETGEALIDFVNGTLLKKLRLVTGGADKIAILIRNVFRDANIPEMKVEVDCAVYPVTTKLDDKGKWSVKVELAKPDVTVAPKMTAWNRVYSVKRRLEIEIREYFDEWMTEVSDDCSHQVSEEQFAQLISSARVKAKERAKRRMEPKQIVKEAFYGFVLTKAKSPFVESFRRLRNEPYT